MRDWSATWKKIRQAPKRDLAFRLASKLGKTLSGRVRPRADSIAYALDVEGLHLHASPVDIPSFDMDAMKALADRTIRGEFDLLGSGPVSAFRGQPSPGFLGHRYDDASKVADENGEFLAPELPTGSLDEAQRIWQKIGVPHLGLDWGRDLKSGFRWSSRDHASQIRVSPMPGADVKLPLELGRLQHLPWLALAFRSTRDETYSQAVRTHLLDFLAANPPGWGPTWLYAMDAGIRAANIVLTMDLFRQLDYKFDAEFGALAARSLVEHGRWLVDEIEWHPERRTNHFFANLAGLIWIATAIPEHEESPIWLAFAEWQLGQEILSQFHPDGGNFEASTAYHRFVLEMALWTRLRLRAVSTRLRETAHTLPVGTRLGRFVLPRPEERNWPESADVRLRSASRFLADATAPDGLASQVGDNDSGRFFKLDGHDDIRRSLETKGTLDVGKILFGEMELPPMATSVGPALANEEPSTVPSQKALTYVIDLSEGDESKLKTMAYPNFGLFIYRTAKTFVSIRCGLVGQAGYGGHAHNDALSIEVFSNGKWLIRDPGSFAYTADSERRDLYRSVAAHHAPQVAGREPNPLDAGLFRLPERAHARVLRFNEHEFLGTHTGYGPAVYRRVRWTAKGLLIEDWSEGDRLELVDLANWRPPPVSLGYGHREVA